MGFDVIVQDVYAPDIGVIGEGIIYFVTKKIHRNITAENIYSDSLVSKNNSCFYTYRSEKHYSSDSIKTGRKF